MFYTIQLELGVAASEEIKCLRRKLVPDFLLTWQSIEIALKFLCSKFYNENNQLSEATICDGKTTKKVCYTYDEDGNLITEYSPTDRSQTSYQYTVEDRLEAVYKGSAYNKTLQMAAAYDGDGNRVYQVNYNPNKDEDFSDYYCSYQNCSYNGTGIQLQAGGEVSQAEKDLMALIGVSGAVRNSSYDHLHDYANAYGNTEGIFLITQYFITGFTARNKDLEIIREGGKYEIKNRRLIVEKHSNPLPENWEDRREKYNKAYEIFGK